MFYVVFYDTWCSTVPESWVNKESFTLRWPLKTENPTTAAKKAIKPKKDWNTFEYSRLLGPYKTFDVARTVEIAAIDLSTSDEAAISTLQNVGELSKKRTRKIPARFRNESSDGAESSDDELLKSVQINPEIALNNDFSYDASNDDVHENNNDNDETQELNYGDHFKDHPKYSSKSEKKVPTIRSIEVLPNMINAPQCSGTNSILKTPATMETTVQTVDMNENVVGTKSTPDSNFQALSKKTDTNNGQSATPIHTDNVTQAVNDQILDLQCSANCCAACSIKLDTLLRLVNSLIINQENNTPIENSRHNILSHSPTLLPAFPISNTLQFDKFNQLLKDNETARSQYVKIIDLRRDQDAKKHTRTVLSYIMTDEFARPLSWTGQKNTVKVKDMEFVKILIAIIAQSNKETSNGIIETAIKSWLQHCGDRIDYRKGNKNKNAINKRSINK